MSMLNKKIDGDMSSILEKCSLLVDGELNDEQIDEFIALYAADEEIGECVQTYHVIGDVLRSADFAGSHVALSQRFSMTEFRKRLAQEPLILAPISLPRKNEQKRRFNLGWPHWTGLAAASVAVVAIAGVFNVSPENTLSEAPQTMITTAAVQESSTPLSQKDQVMNRVAATVLNTVNQENRRVAPAYYIAAHHQFGYDSIVNRGYTQGQIVQTTASK